MWAPTSRITARAQCHNCSLTGHLQVIMRHSLSQLSESVSLSA